MSETTLDAVCSLIVDCPHSTPVWTTSGVVVLRSNNIRGGRLDITNASFTDEEHFRDRVRRAVPQGGDIVITREAPMGEVCMVPAGLRCCLGQRMVLLRPDASLINGRFLLMALQSPSVQRQIMMHEGTGSTVSNLRIPALKALKISLPSQREQFAVAELLGALDDKIELNRRTSETLDAMACGKLDEWEQEARMSPADWESVPLGQCGVWLSGGTPNRSVARYWGGEFPFVTYHCEK